MFNPTDKLTQIKGKDYLEVKWRLVWLREVHPDWQISTEIVELNTEQSWCIFKATIADKDGNLIATGHKVETKQNFNDFLEKAETGAIGRALGMAGFGTQFTGDEFDEGSRIVDSPTERKNGRR